MPGKHLTNVVRHFSKVKRREAGAFVPTVFFTAFLLNTAFGESTNSLAAPQFLGSPGCSSSSCHGGAGEKSKQYTIWFTHDFHHARPYATLETARSERLAEVLKIGNAAQSARCTVCHAPFATVPAERLGHDAQIAEGVSCESCHGPGENWIRSHTRPDYTHADRVAAGMRDLKDLYVRANTCVACHQNIDPEIRAAGHPELMFEMDGQSVIMPKHWSEKSPGSQIWFVGQAVAAREMSWQLSNQASPDRTLMDRWGGLLWVLGFREQPTVNFLSPTSEDFARVQASYDHYARQSAHGELSIDPAKAVDWLANSSNSFADKNISKSLLSRRAERLVLALDRLLPEIRGAHTNAAVNESLNKLFADAQSLPDFDPAQFTKDLNTFHSSVAGFLENK